ncbi:DUF5983 family protein [Sphingobium xenophagum]|uniref:DUF5983 domain-containing protein n=1 Tax=Sphingobium xenophagum TaxID=121428 RepID=A0A401J8F4_SPHXE|nr:hypothetical protein [Sphingobium xenophagum]GBH32848.1 hypothetical protein MBESOW_P4079 [Sphingobium xenophagum]
MTRYTLSHLETAACLWEAVLEQRDRLVTNPDANSRALALRKCVDILGTAALRLVVVGWVDAVEAAWRAVEGEYPLSFDWDFVPRWIADTIDWSDPRHPVIRGKPPGANAPVTSTPPIGDDAASGRDGHLALLARARAALVAADTFDPPARYALINAIRASEDAIAACPLPWPIEVHTAVIEHRHGMNIYVAADEMVLDAEIGAYCREYWSEIDDSRDPNALSDAKVTSSYFECHPSESCTKDRVRLSPVAHPAPLAAGSIEQGRYCVLSTAHLTVHTASCLDKWASWPPSDRPIDIAASVYGWFVPTRAIDDDRRAQLPQDLLRLIAFGRTRGFQFLLFDCDGSDVDGLPLHHW